MMVKNCLEKAERDGFKSISFPALGTGVYNYDGTSSAKGLFDAMVEFSRATVSVDNVSVVLHEESRANVKEVSYINLNIMILINKVIANVLHNFHSLPVQSKFYLCKLCSKKFELPY